MTHDEATDLAERFLDDALCLLRRAADLLRGPDMVAGTIPMRVEIAVTKAIEALDAAPSLSLAEDGP